MTRKNGCPIGGDYHIKMLDLCWGDAWKMAHDSIDEIGEYGECQILPDGDNNYKLVEKCDWMLEAQKLKGDKIKELVEMLYSISPTRMAFHIKVDGEERKMAEDWKEAIGVLFDLDYTTLYEIERIGINLKWSCEEFIRLSQEDELIEDVDVNHYTYMTIRLKKVSPSSN